MRDAPRDSVRRDFPVALAAPLGLCLLLGDSTLSRLDGLLLLAAFAAWLGAVLPEA